MSDINSLLDQMGLGLNTTAPKITPTNDIKTQPIVTLADVARAEPNIARLLSPPAIGPLASARDLTPPKGASDSAAAELNRLYEQKSNLESRAVTSVMTDAVVDVAGGFVGLVGSAVGLGISAVGGTAKLVSPEGSVIDHLGDSIKEFAVDYGQTTNWAVDKIQRLSSETDAENTRLNSMISQIESDTNLAEYNESIAQGDNSFIAAITLFGKDLLDNGVRVISDPIALQSVVAQGVGSLGPSAKLARAGVELARAGAAKLGLTGGANLARAEMVGSAVGTGVVEAAGTYSSTISEVMSKSTDEMMTSQRYRELLSQGVAPDKAQKQVADEAGIHAFKIGLPAAILAGTIATKFNANPLDTFTGKSLIEGLREVGHEVLEEGLQGGASQIAQNIAIQQKIDPNQVLAEGVGGQVAVGALAGAGTAGVIGAPGVARTAYDKRFGPTPEQKAETQRNQDVAVIKFGAARAEAIKQTTQPTPETTVEVDGEPLVVSGKLGTPLSKKAQAELDFLEANKDNPVALKPLYDAAQAEQVNSETKTQALIRNVKENVIPVVKTVGSAVIQKATEYTEKSNPVFQTETVSAAESVATAARDTGVNTGILGITDQSVKSDNVPEIFKDSIPEGSSIADTMVGIVKTLAEKKTPISTMSEDAVLFVTQKLNEMQNVALTLAPEVRAKIKKVLASPDLERIRKRAARLDLNTLISPTVEKVSAAVKAMTVAMSKINPTNVNPDVVDKILKQEDRGDLTPEDIQDMEVAASVSRPMNQLINNIVKIEDDKNAFLVSSGQKPDTEENSFEKVSRRLIEGDPTNQEKLPSVKKSINQIILGMRSPDKAVDVDGVRVPVDQVITRFKNLTQHMLNKVTALNESFDQNDEKGVGPTINFPVLSSKTGKFIPVGQAGSGNAVYNKRSIKSVTFAKTVGADAAMLVEVHNALAKAYPDQFPDGPIALPVLKTQESENTTAVESVPTAVGTDENAQTTQDVTPDQTPETKAVEDASKAASETIVTGLTQEKADAMDEEELIASVNSWEPGVQSTPMEQGRVDSIMAIMDPLIASLKLPDNMIRLLTWLKSDSPTHAGQAYWVERVISLKPSVVRKILANEDAGGIHIFLHELFHVIDAKASKKFGRTASMDALEFDLLDGGEVYDEVKTLSDSDPEMKEYFSYAFSVSTPEEVASELFAEIGAMMMLMDRETARSLLPKGVAYVERIVEQAGGAKVETNGDTPPVTDQAPESVPEAAVESKVSDRFVSVFRTKKNTKRLAAKEILDRIAEKDGTETYREFATILVGRISAAMNNRLQTVLLSKSDGRSLAQGLKEDQAKLLDIRDFKPLMIVDPETGRYNQELLDLASMAVIDWMTTARSYGADRLDDMLKELGLEYNDVPDAEIRDLLNSVPTRTTSEGLAKKVIKLWTVQVNKDAQMVDIRGTTEGLVKEIFTVISQMEDPLVRIIELKTGEGRTASFEISNLKGEQEAIGLNAAGSLDKVLFPEDQIQASFGEKIAFVPKAQNNKADVPLSALEQKAIKKMQDTAHTEAVPVVNFFAALGLDAWAMMAGKKDSSALGKRHPLRLTIEGKNTSIERDFETAFQMVTAAAGREVFYPIGVTNVGRHQMKGINPQNNKLLRAMITPTHSKLNMGSNQKHKNAFWLTVAQSSGLAKVEKKMHTKILSTIQEDFAAKFGEATRIALAFLETGTLDQQGFTNAMLKANKGEDVDVAQVNAVLAVARLQQAQKAGTLDSFETSLSFELDGKTDGPANMMVAFGQGIMTRMEYQNFKRIGLFLGSKGETLNSLFSGGEVDLYEVNSTFADIRMTEMINSSTGMFKKRLMALQRFAARFGDFVINPDGTIQMSRATSKNPMTKKVYGSGERGIAGGIAQEMLVGFYKKLVAKADGVAVEDHLNYQEINQDLDLLFGVKLPDVLDVNNFILPNAKTKPFFEFVKETIGTILSESINQVMSEKTTGVSDLLVFSTGVQNEFMKLLFEQRLAEAMAELNEEYGDSGNQKKGKPALRKMPQSTYDAIVKETLAFAPYFADGLQNLRIGDFTGQVDNTEMSSNLSGNVRAKSTMARPDDMGVKAIPYVIQGRGDAMMMNRIFGADNAPERTIPIFDGIDMAISDFTDLADQINEAVLSNWDQDVLGSIVSNVDVFLARVEEQGLGDKLQDAFSIVRVNSKNKTSVTVLDSSQLVAALAEVHRMNQARKAVFKRITLAVDHMGGSGQAYIRNYDGKELTFEEINDMIQNELDKIVRSFEPVIEPSVSKNNEKVSSLPETKSNGRLNNKFRKLLSTIWAESEINYLENNSLPGLNDQLKKLYDQLASSFPTFKKSDAFTNYIRSVEAKDFIENFMPRLFKYEFSNVNTSASAVEGQQEEPVEFVDRYSVESVRAGAKQNKVYVFGDNLIQRGKKGQAIIRDEPNAIGIPTKRLPSMDKNAFFGVNLAEEKAAITKAVDKIIAAIKEGKIIVMPSDGVGTGLSNLESSSPEMFKHLQSELARAGLLPVIKIFEEDEEPVVVTDVATVVDALIREIKPHLRDVIRAIRGMLPDNARIVMGTEEQIAQWRKENLGQNQSKKLDQKTKGFYDVDANIIFIMSDNHETMVHEMIHMATFQAVLDHYEGTKKSTAVKNLEVLMEEFLALDTTTMGKEAQEAYFDAKRAIVKAQAEASPMGDAVALNEFMAWTLANDGLMKELKQTPTSLITRLTKVAKAWIQRILGVVPLDMYSHILFNTEMIRNNESDWDGTPPPPATPTVGVTPPADAFTNFWIDRLRDALEASKTPDGKNTQDKLIRYIATADDALVKLDFGGFSLSEYQKKTFVAIHAVIAAELRLDPNALIALGKVYEHITNNLTPQMFGTGQGAQDRYSAVMELMGATKNDEGISDAIAVMLALSQTSNGFRSAMEQIPQPAAQPGIQTNSLNDLLTSTTGFLIQKLIATTDTEGKGVKETLDALGDQILRQDNQNEFRALKTLMGTFDKADAFVGGALSLLAQKTRDFNRGVQASQTNGIFKVVSGSVALATAFMDANTSAQAGKGAKAATHMGGILDGAVFIREFVAEVVGADAINSDVIQMLDKVTRKIQQVRQDLREDLPIIFQNEFTTHPDAKQWKALHWVLGKTDFASLFDLSNPDDSFDMLNDQALLDRRIKTRETKIMKAFPGQDGKNILEKAQQLAEFMNGKGAGFQLMKNAYAIHKLAVGQNNKPNMVAEIDKLVSLYALNGTDIAQREAVAAMQTSDPNGVHNLLVYVQALNKEEDQKTITEAARTNGYKGYIPDHGQGEVSLIIARDTERENLEKRGYVRVADDTTDPISLVSRGYYMTTVKQSGNYSQGVLQQVQDTYRGVNTVTGLTVNGTTSGVIAGVAVSTITDALNQSLRVADPKNVLLPVYDEDGAVLYYERGINPDLREKYLQPESNMALMAGVWAGRQVEEKFSHEYNKALVQRLKEIWDNREPSTDGLFIRMDQAKDKIYAESWGVIPPQLKEHILATFGEDTGFMIRKDMINLALGYRDPSIVDVWTGNHRLPESVELAIKTVGKLTMGDKAYKWLANSESLTMNTISTAKDFIVVRSLVVPFMNTQSNVFQLVNRSVGTKQIMRGYKEKFVEIEKLNQNLKKIMGLQARVRLAATDKNKVAILKQQIQVLEDENERFSVSPLVKEGAYKNISEGITDLDVSITDGKFGDWVESQLNRLPAGVQTVVKYGLLSKDTALYKGANKAVQYGDFVAKSIYYDDLRAKGLSHDATMVKVNEEFINFSLLPGRTRTYLESMGATWFLTFKIRAMKVALQMMRENPVRSLAAVGLFGLDSGPVTDNMVTKGLEGTLPYSLGWDMLFDAPGMVPWLNITNG